MAQAAKSKDRQTGLWQGFAAGAVSGAGILFLLGTKRGREILRKALDISEDLEKNLEEYVDGIGEELQERIAPILPHTPYKTGESLTGLGNVIDKIKTISEGKRSKK